MAGVRARTGEDRLHQAAGAVRAFERLTSKEKLEIVRSAGVKVEKSRYVGKDSASGSIKKKRARG